MKNKDYKQALVSFNNIIELMVEDDGLSVVEYKLLLEYGKVILTMKECEVKCANFI